MELLTDISEALELLNQSKPIGLGTDLVEEVLTRLEADRQPYLLTYYPEHGERPEHWLVQLPVSQGQYLVNDTIAPTVESALAKWLNQRRVLVNEDIAIVLAEGLSVMGLAYLCLYHPDFESTSAHFEFRKPEYQGAVLF